MKQRGQLIIDEFELLRSVAPKSGLELDPEITQGRGHFRKRDKLFKKLRLDPNNEHHVAFLCSIVYDHLYLSKPSAATTKYGDNKDFDLLGRVVNFRKKSPSQRPSKVYRSFVEQDKMAKAQYGGDASIDRFRRRVERAAKKAIAGKMKLTAKRQARLLEILPDVERLLASPVTS